MLKRFEIKNLFDEYNYVIDFDQSSFKDLLYVTGPNGMGKTTIMRMIAGLSHFDPEAYAKIPFEHLRLTFDNGEIINLSRIENNLQPDLKTDEEPNIEVILKCEYRSEKAMLSISELCAWLYEKDAMEKSFVFKDKEGDKMTNMMMLLESDQCRFFQDDRIFKAFDGEYEKRCVDPKTIKNYLKDLQMGLDNSFTYREDGIAIDEWPEVEKRKERVLKILDFLKGCDIFIGGFEQYKKFNEVDGADLIYLLKRYENAIRVNRDEIAKLQAYSKAIRRFGFIGKELRLSPQFGYRMVPKSGKPLKFEELASGEKHLLCLLNGLFFVQTESPLVLIDEPEMSYHMYWQMQFCKTMKEIVKLMHLRVLVATHAPQMFDGDFSLTTDLYRQYKRQ